MNFLFGILNLELKGLTSESGVPGRSVDRAVRLKTLGFILVSFTFFLFPSVSHANSLLKVPSNLGLAGYWSMNEGTSTVVGDTSGNNNHGTFQGTPTWVSGKLGKGLNFSVYTNYVLIPDNATLHTTSAVTLSAWVKLNANTDAQPIIFKDGNYRLQIQNGIVQMAWWDGVGGGAIRGVEVSAPTAGTWHHVVGVATGNDASAVYIDGVLMGTTSFQVSGGVARVLTNPVVFGTGSGGGYNGSIDEARIYTRALSASEVAALYNTKVMSKKTVSNQGLVGYWPMEESSGTQLDDFSGNNNRGTFNNSLISWSKGKFGSALQFNSASQVGVAVPNSQTLNPTNTITVSAWIYPTSWSGNNRILQKGSGDNQYRFTAETGQLRFEVFTGSQKPVSTTLPTVNKWTHIAGVYDQSSVRLYIDGVLAGTLAATDPIGTTNNELVIGCKSSTSCATSDGFNGKIDDIRIYNRALTIDEIRSLASSGGQVASGKAQTDIVSSGLVGYWPFGGNYMNWATGKALDASGNGNDGNFVGLATSTSVTTGRVGQALRFNGINSYVNAGSNPSITDVGSMSVCAWIRPRANPPGFWGGIASKSSGGASNGWQFYIYGSNPPYGLGFFNNDGDAVEKDPAPITLNEWQHVCGVWDGNSGLTGRKLYLNGAVLTGTSLTNFAGASSDSGYSLGIGTLGAAPYLFSGDIDEVRVYDRNITAQEVQQLYSAGR